MMKNEALRSLNEMSASQLLFLVLSAHPGVLAELTGRTTSPSGARK